MYGGSVAKANARRSIAPRIAHSTRSQHTPTFNMSTAPQSTVVVHGHQRTLHCQKEIHTDPRTQHINNFTTHTKQGAVLGGAFGGTALFGVHAAHVAIHVACVRGLVRAPVARSDLPELVQGRRLEPQPLGNLQESHTTVAPTRSSEPREKRERENVGQGKTSGRE